ncbi:MAG: hypothetical protein KDA42_06800 [Planctomycetales bacterium]|nr:hypothetical protein [Planctomycetales bacterium]
MKRLVVIACLLLSVAEGRACNVPVFRYALERWRADAPEVIIFHRGSFSDAQQNLVEQAKENALFESGELRYELVERDVEGDLEPDLQQRWLEINDQVDLPCALVQHRKRGITYWRGGLADFAAGRSLDSPVLNDVVKQTVAGASAVWLVMNGSDSQQAAAAKVALREKLDELEQEILLPEGIGEPGSELYSNVPMKVAFAVVEFDADDPQEKFLAKFLNGFAPDAVADGASLVVPVFGRGRALEVFSSEQIEPQLIAEVTTFLCGACSCTVKEINPGFDLPLMIDWDRVLFERTAPADLVSTVAEASDVSEPEYVAIPSGRTKTKSAGPSAPNDAVGEAASAASHVRVVAAFDSAVPTDPRLPRMMFVAVLGLAAFVLVGERFSRK